MSRGATSFNQPLNKWNVSMTNMNGMFYYAESFNQQSFNQPLNNWDVSNVEDMRYMFAGAESPRGLPSHWHR